ncbi:MAG: hypothetical protein A2V70_11640 [Planctomycetes bacterium RBG_13_63_9]|nr:MAG: hypothetical protein A2V70_11640 [Planctomycetes bacterium RBG_13_63_9]
MKPSDAPEDDGDESWPALSTVDMHRPEKLLADTRQPDRPAPVAQAPEPDPGSDSQPVPEAEPQPETKPEPDLGPKPDSQPPSQRGPETEPQSKPEVRKVTEETGDPFRELKPAVNLPALPGTDPSQAGPSDSISLGSLHVPEDGSAKITLEGGKDAVKGSREFTIEPGDGSNWTIHLNRQVRPPAESERIDVAQIRLDDAELRFQWLKPADQGRADCLRNCGLWITVGEEGQWLPFAMPKEVEPLVVDFDDGRAAISLPAERWMPKAGDLRLKITTLEGPFPKHAFQPADGVTDQGHLGVSLSAAGLPDAKLDVLLVARGRQPRLEVIANYRLAEQPWLPLNLPAIESHKMRMVLEYTRLKSITDHLAKTDPKRAPVRERRELFKAWAEQLDALWKLCKDLNDAGRIGFRVFVPVGKHEVDLFATPPPGR